jgi:hypothetical protein
MSLVHGTVTAALARGEGNIGACAGPDRAILRRFSAPIQGDSRADRCVRRRVATDVTRAPWDVRGLDQFTRTTALRRDRATTDEIGYAAAS